MHTDRHTDRIISHPYWRQSNDDDDNDDDDDDDMKTD